MAQWLLHSTAGDEVEGSILVVIGERAKRARHYQGCTNSSWCDIYICIYMYGGTYAIIVAHATHT